MTVYVMVGVVVLLAAVAVLYWWSGRPFPDPVTGEPTHDWPDAKDPWLCRACGERIEGASLGFNNGYGQFNWHPEHAPETVWLPKYGPIPFRDSGTMKPSWAALRSNP